MRFKGIALVLVISIFLLLGACSKQGEKKPAPSPAKIGVSLALTDPNWEKLLEKTVKQQAKEDRMQLEWQNAEGDAQKQTEQIDKLLNQDIKALIVQFADPLMAPSTVQRLVAKGIKVVVLGELPQNTPMDAFVGVDFSRLGEMQAQYLTGLKEQGLLAGDVAVLLPEQPSQGVVEVAGNCERSLRDNGFNVRSERLPEQSVGAYLDAGIPAAMVIENPDLLRAVLQELQLRRKTEEVVTVGLGGDKEAAQALAAGLHDAEADPELELVVQQGFRTAVDLVKEGSWNYQIKLNNGTYDVRAELVPVRLITLQNVYLLEQRWGTLGPPQPGQQGKKETEKQGSGGSDQQGSDLGSQNSKSGSGESKDAQGSQQGQKVLIKTKDGQTMEVQVPGQIEQVIIGGQQQGKDQQKAAGGGKGEGQ